MTKNGPSQQDEAFSEYMYMYLMYTMYWMQLFRIVNETLEHF